MLGIVITATMMPNIVPLKQYVLKGTFVQGMECCFMVLYSLRKYEVCLRYPISGSHEESRTIMGFRD